MRNNVLKSFFLPLFISVILFSCKNQSITPPDVKQIAKELTIHSDTRIDNYYWLNDRENPEVIAYLEAENEYTKAVLKPTEKFQEDLFNELKSRIKEDDKSVPYKERGFFYYSRYETGKEYPIYCRKKESLDAPEEILLDVNKMAEGYKYFQVSGLSVSPDNKILAYGVDTVSRRKYTIYFKNIETGELQPETIVNAGGSATWANDNKTVFYEQKDEQTLREYKIFRHELGTDSSNDKEIFFESDETFSTYVFKSKSDQYIFIGSSSTMSDEYRVLDANNPNGEFKIIQPRERGLEYSVSHLANIFIYIQI